MTNELIENIYADEPSQEKPECKACGYVLAAVGLFLGTVFLYMSIDVLSGGKLTSILGLGTARGTDTEVTE